MTAVTGHARRMCEQGHPAGREASILADLFCRSSRRTVTAAFHALWRTQGVRSPQKKMLAALWR